MLQVSVAVCLTCVLLAQPPAPTEAPLDWKTLEAPGLSRHAQLTKRDKFIKAGEAYFSPKDDWIIFQAIEAPKPGKEAEPFYAMYVARVQRDDQGAPTGLSEPVRVSADGSANTCGWFDPVRGGMVLFGSTVTRPSEQQKSGFQVGSRKYVWMFPQEMEVVERAVVPLLGIPVEGGAYADSTAAATAMLREEIVALRARLDKASAVPAGVSPAAPKLKTELELLNIDLKQMEELAPFDGAAKPVFQRPNYDAECSYSADGRFILYSHVEDQKEGERPDANIYIYDTQTRKHHPIVVAPGYDGGPFFSPDGRRICYRSDRKGNDLLQVYVADLKFDDGVPVGIECEYQITNNEHVNWAPYWHPSGKFLVYGTSEVSHGNYEVFAVELDPKKLAAAKAGAGSPQVAVSDLRRKRITRADGADVLPVFSHDGEWMMWTSQRGPKVDGEEKPSSQLWIARFQEPAWDQKD